MGAFYISPKDINPDNDVLKIFEKKGFGAPNIFLNEKTILLSYKKQLFSSINNVDYKDFSLHIFGSCFYKNKNYSEGLNSILQDYVRGCFNPNNLLGSYFLLFLKKNQSFFYSDPAGVQNIFFHKHSGIISSSFLACVVGAAKHAGKLTLNTKALTEVILTGNLIGPDTLVNEILRYEHSIHRDLPNIDRLNIALPEEDKKQRSGQNSTFDYEIKNQLNILNEYFSSITTILDNMGGLTGLTGGFDSRLLFLLLNKKTNNLKLYSTHKKIQTKELIVANKLANALSKTLHSPKYQSYLEIHPAQMLDMLDHNFYFNDGLIRTHQLWTEEINSCKYLTSLYGKYHIKFSGVGGEQYRNGEFLTKPKYSFRQWFFYEFIYKHCKQPFTSKEKRTDWLDYIEQKITSLLNVCLKDKQISHFDIKRFYNEIYNSANRVTRNNVENQLNFFLSPFTDSTVSKTAYNAYKYIGSHHNFEKEMIYQLEPKLAYIELDYGYAISNKVPLKISILPFLKKILGFKCYYYIIKTVKGSSHTYSRITKKHPELKRYVLLVENLRLPISLKHIKESNHLSPLLIQTGFLLDKLTNYISYD